jgi:hypothetical protein
MILVVINGKIISKLSRSMSHTLERCLIINNAKNRHQWFRTDIEGTTVDVSTGGLNDQS